MRKKFFEAKPQQADKSSLGAKGLAYCEQLFSLERDWEDLSADERLQKRQEKLHPLNDSSMGFPPCFLTLCTKKKAIISIEITTFC